MISFFGDFVSSTLSPLDSGSYSINRPSSLRGTPNGTPRGTPITRGPQRSSLINTPRLTSYGAVFSGGTPSSRGTSPMPGSLPSRAVMSHTAAVASHSADFSPPDPVMTPPPHSLLSGPPEPQGRRLVHSHSRDSFQRSQDLMYGGKPV